MSADTKHLHIPSTTNRFPSDWSWVRLEDACSGVFDCPHSTPKLAHDGPLMVRTQDILSGVFRREEAAHVSEETYRERTHRAEPHEGDLLFSREGTYFGIAAEVPPGVRVCLGQRMVLIRPLPGRVHHRFLRYWLNSPLLAAHIHGYRDGSVAERLNLPTIRALPVPLPRLDQQIAIADVLGSLDDKIEVNYQTNRTLKRMAAAVFKAWFVDFEPIRAKALGIRSFPIMPRPVFDQLPSKLVQMKVGAVPQGWGVAKIGDILELAYGKALKEGDRRPGPYRVFGSNGSVGSHDEYLVKGPGIVLGRKGNPGVVTWAESNFFPIDTTFYVIPTGHVRSMHYLYHMLVRQNLGSLGSDSAVPGLNRNLAYMSDTLVPPAPLLGVFEEVAEGLARLVASRERESLVLATTRDALLPKLLCGNVRVAASPSATEAVA